MATLNSWMLVSAVGPISFDTKKKDIITGEYFDAKKGDIIYLVNTSATNPNEGFVMTGTGRVFGASDGYPVETIPDLVGKAKSYIDREMTGMAQACFS